jgi:thiol-disulfide isomerase/thioredoxin
MVHELNFYVVLYYLPYCKYCKEFKPIFEKFSEELKRKGMHAKTYLYDVTDKMGTIPEHLTAGPFQTVPRVVFIKHNHSILYEGKRTVKDLMDFSEKMI